MEEKPASGQITQCIRRACTGEEKKPGNEPGQVTSIRPRERSLPQALKPHRANETGVAGELLADLQNSYVVDELPRLSSGDDKLEVQQRMRWIAGHPCVIANRRGFVGFG